MTARNKSTSSARTRAKLRKLEHRFPKGHKIFVEGEASGEMYILLSGKLDIISKGVNVGSIDQPGSYVGEMSVLLGDRRSATVVVKQDVRVLKIPEKEIIEFLTHAPELALKLSRMLASRLKTTNTSFAAYRLEMSTRYQELTNRLHKIFMLSKSRARNARADMAQEIRNAATYLSGLTPMEDQDRGSRYV